MRRRPTLRTRLLASLVLTAAGALTLAGAATYLIVQATAEEAAIDDLRDKSDEIQRQASTFRDLLQDRQGQAGANPRPDPQGGDGSRLTPAQQVGTYLNAVIRLLRLADARVVFVADDGSLADPAALDRPAMTAGVRADVFTLPETVPAADLDTARLLDEETVTGTNGSIVFLAQPIDTRVVSRTPLGKTVIVLTQKVDTNVVGRAGPAFVVAGAAALAVCVALSLWLARRLTRPLQAVEVTARRLAAGDLTARVAVHAGTEDELAALAATLNTMAAQLEQARGAERAFLLSVSHDLRTPLTSIRGYADALADGTIDAAGPEERVRAAGIISGEARRLERLVRDLLDLSRLDTRQFSLHPRPCDAAGVVRDAAGAFGPAAGDLGLSLHTDDMPAVIPADLDPERLGQIVANLVENALKYAATTVEVSVKANALGFDVVVADDGPGIPTEQAPKVFERLYTVRGTPGRSVGTGLGLAIVRELARAMGGNAAVETSNGHGTRFVVHLPTGPPGPTTR